MAKAGKQPTVADATVKTETKAENKTIRQLTERIEKLEGYLERPYFPPVES